MEAGFLSIDVDPPAERLASKVEAWASLLDDGRPFFRDADDLIANHERRHFDTEGASTGGRFARLSPNYKVWKDGEFPGMPILQLRGHLHKAVVDRGAGYQRRIGKTKASFGVSPRYTTPAGDKLIAYARANTFGVGVPVRPVYRWDPRIQKADRSGGTMPLGTALSQLRQAHVVLARRRALGSDDKALGPAGSAEKFADRVELLKRRKTS
jgi:hypothetical protein